MTASKKWPKVTEVVETSFEETEHQDYLEVIPATIRPGSVLNKSG